MNIYRQQIYLGRQTLGACQWMPWMALHSKSLYNTLSEKDVYMKNGAKSCETFKMSTGVKKIRYTALAQTTGFRNFNAKPG